MAGPFDNLGREFANFASYVAGDADPTVTVEQMDPDSGSAILTAEGVVALKLTSTGQPMSIGAGGSLGITECQFWLEAAPVGFLPKPLDRITECDGTRWLVETCERVGYGETGTLYRCPVTRARS